VIMIFSFVGRTRLDLNRIDLAGLWRRALRPYNGVAALGLR
jgi:hypothetical protein